jgi:multiple sugar transport system substrate-binding protein
MFRRTLFVLAILTLPLSCSCSNQGGSGKVSLTFWQFWTDPEVKPVLRNLVERFEEQNPGVKVEITDLTWGSGHEKIAVAFGSNSAPDVLELGSDWVPEFAHQEVLYDMTAEVDSVKTFYRMWKPAVIGDKCYGFPWILDTRVLFYNKALMRKAGINAPGCPLTWSDLSGAVQKIHNPENKIYGFGANSAERHRLYKKFLPFFWGNNGLILSPPGKECWINSKEGRQALEFYVELTKYGLIDTQLRLDQAFMEQRLGFVISGGWLLQQIRKDKPDLDFGVCLIPRPGMETGIHASFAGAEFLVINKKTKHPREAMRFIGFLSDLDNSLELCKAIGTPSPAHALAPLDPYYSEDPYLRIFQEQLSYSMTPPAVPQWVYIEEEIERAVEKAMYGKETPKKALDEAKQRIERLLAE